MSSKLYAIDCEMVESHGKSILARVSVVNQNGLVVLDEYVKPTGPVTNYRELLSGIRRQHLVNGKDFNTVRDRVADLLSGCILIGHSLKYDLETLGLSYTERNQRDLATYKPLMKNGQPVALKTLAREYLGRIIQNWEHDSVEDARACMDIYNKYSHQWERN